MITTEHMSHMNELTAHAHILLTNNIVISYPKYVTFEFTVQNCHTELNINL